MINDLKIKTGLPDLKTYNLKFNNAEVGKSFSDTLIEHMYDVNKLQKDAAKKVEGLITGETRNLHDVTIAGQKSKIAFDLMLEVRKKLLEGFQEIMRTQV